MRKWFSKKSVVPFGGKGRDRLFGGKGMACGWQVWLFYLFLGLVGGYFSVQFYYYALSYTVMYYALFWTFHILKKGRKDIEIWLRFRCICSCGVSYFHFNQNSPKCGIHIFPQCGILDYFRWNGVCFTWHPDKTQKSTEFQKWEHHYLFYSLPTPLMSRRQSQLIL